MQSTNHLPTTVLVTVRSANSTIITIPFINHLTIMRIQRTGDMSTHLVNRSTTCRRSNRYPLVGVIADDHHASFRTMCTTMIFRSFARASSQVIGGRAAVPGAVELPDATPIITLVFNSSPESQRTTITTR